MEQVNIVFIPAGFDTPWSSLRITKIKTRILATRFFTFTWLVPPTSIQSRFSFYLAKAIVNLVLEFKKVSISSNQGSTPSTSFLSCKYWYMSLTEHNEDIVKRILQLLFHSWYNIREHQLSWIFLPFCLFYSISKFWCSRSF